MPHVSITFNPVYSAWELMRDGAQTRVVVYRGKQIECKTRGRKLARKLGQRLFLFDRAGSNPIEIKR